MVQQASIFVTSVIGAKFLRLHMQILMEVIYYIAL